MSLFDNILKDSETLFKNEYALNFEFIPKTLPFRENEQHYIASCIKPLLNQRQGKNLFIFGPPGIGKTAATRFVLRELEEETDNVMPIYINCWKKNTSYKIAYDICEQLNLKFLQNKRTDELLHLAKKVFTKLPAVFVFDEIDKLEDNDFLYFILEEIPRKTVLLITNYKEWIAQLDSRIRSRLTAEFLEFRQYKPNEIKEILRQRIEYAFFPSVWQQEAFNLIAEKTAQLNDIRTGLFLLREAGNIAEMQASRKITIEHAKKAIEKMDDFSIKDSTLLEPDLREILSIVKQNDNKKIGDLYKIFKEKTSSLISYKTFQRKIKKLAKDGFISITKTGGGDLGNTSIIRYQKIKKLTDFR